MISSYLLAAGLSLTVQPGCEACHADIARSFAATGMGQSVGSPSQANTRFRHQLSGSVLSINGRRHRIERGSLYADYPARLRIGSGKVGSSFAVLIASRWFQSPISWYAQLKQFRISPGFEQERYPDFDRSIRSECLYCHSSAQSVDGEGTIPLPITCSRCHGNGFAHAAKPARGNIINPVRLTGAVRDSVCEQCHLPGVARILNPQKRLEDYSPGQVLEDTWTTYVTGSEFRVASHSEQLAKSACMLAARSRLWCGSCHNPHPTSSRPAPVVDAVCRSCHQQHDGGWEGCATCHMPARGVRDVVHTSYTDHRIQLPGKPEVTGSTGLRPYRPGAHPQRNLALAWLELAASTRDKDAIERADALISQLPDSGDDPQVLSARAAIASHEEALELHSRALKLQPQNPEIFLRMGRSHQAANRSEMALQSYEQAIKLNPLLFDAYIMAAQIHRSRGEREAYRRVLRQFLRHVPASLAARQALAAEF